MRYIKFENFQPPSSLTLTFALHQITSIREKSAYHVYVVSIQSTPSATLAWHAHVKEII